MLRPLAGLGLSLALLSPQALSQDCPLVLDYMPGGSPISSSIDIATPGLTAANNNEFVEVAGQWFFSANTLATQGRELWVTDGTTAGTRLVKDIAASGPSNPSEFASIGGLLYFQANDGIHGIEPWVSDGTEAGTRMLLDLNPLSQGSKPADFVALGARALFAASDGANGRELWITDGTAAGTTMLEVKPGALGSNPTEPEPDATGTTVFFAADDGVTGKELWRTDGTSAGTWMVLDIKPGANGSEPRKLRTWGGRTYFSAKDGTNGRELWATDGTAAGTVLIKDIAPGAASSGPQLAHSAEFNGELYFAANDPASPFQFWKTDGTTAGTQFAANVPANTVLSSVSGMVVVGSRLLFGAKGIAAVGHELFAINSAGALIEVMDIWPGSNSGFKGNGRKMLEINGRVWFPAQSGPNGIELWASNGTTAGTKLVKDINPGSLSSDPAWITPSSSSSILFVATKDDERELWTSDLSAPGTKLLANVETSQHGIPARIENLTAWRNTHLLFEDVHLTPHPGVVGSWTAATGMVSTVDFLPPGLTADLGGMLTAWLDDREVTFFWGGPGSAYASGVWVTEGTLASTRLVLPVDNTLLEPTGKFFTLVGDRVYFLSNTTTGLGLYKSDGSVAGTVLVQDLTGHVVPEAFLGTHPSFVEAGGKLFFCSYPEASVLDWQLWCSDGTSAGTAIVPGIMPFGQFTPWLVEIQNQLYLGNATGPQDLDIIKTDGTVAGTSVVAPLLFDFQPMDFSDLFVLNGELYYVTNGHPASGVGNGPELQKVDPRTGNVTRLMPVNSSFPASSVHDVQVVGERAFFVARRTQDAEVIWSTDGTIAGTAAVTEDLASNGFYPTTNLTAADGGIYFTGALLHGESELFFTDGTLPGTHVVCDLDISAGTYAETLTLLDGSLYFMGYATGTGVELYHLPYAGPYAADLGTQFANGASLRATTPKLGGNLTVSCDGVPAAHVSLLLLSAPVLSPVSLFTSAGNGSWLDLASARTLASFTTSTWDWTVPLPQQSGLVGASVHLQNYMLPGGSLPAKTSNALVLVLGN